MNTLEYQQLNPKECQQEPDACIIWLHGLGATANDLMPIVPQLTLPDQFDIRFIFPQAPMQPVTINMGTKMPAWYDISGFGIDSQQDEAGIRATETALVELIDTQIAEGIASEKIVLVGFSQGGAMALHTALRYPKKLAGVIALSSYLPIADLLEEEKTPANYGLPIFIAHGDNDAVLPLQAAHITCQYLKDLDYQVSENYYSMGHEICPSEINDISTWLNKVLVTEKKTRFQA